MTTTTDQEINFTNYFGTNNGAELESKKKKASRACLHCQRAHLTCDDSRPCQRCVKRDLASTCTDAARKRAKYLQDIPVDELFNTSSSSNSQPTSSSAAVSSSSSAAAAAAASFNNSIVDSAAATSAPTTTAPMHLSTIGMQQMMSNNGYSSSLSPASSTTTAAPFYNMGFNPQMQHQQHQQQQHITPLPNNSRSSPLSDTTSMLTMKRPSNASSVTSASGRRKGYGNTPEETYTGVKRPFNYAEGFHYLIQHVRDKMSRDDLMRISRALALFRPSFLALIMNLTEEDLVFMEKCLQRTLLEYEKLISFSGTPTVVWRRTGEICLVGKEFSLLTQWTKDMLLGKKIYIYELMDSQSAVEYWEKFATHAFDNTDKSCVYSCIIKTPQQKPVPCTFCFTIKRDIFDLPSVIIGNVSLSTIKYIREKVLMFHVVSTYTQLRRKHSASDEQCSRSRHV
ncbi:Zn(2)-C6 fungal-specific transcription factor [Mucor lusitanicus]|uniref:Zn(2)-C6 fungal-specific transcription factor n=1 Tax=Mucor circinelloides f. lusitanicus TaxID=29924 RepID=A0A8H4B7M7_MUCCL|nr:Zn(2)-C6 fungal-specific transcription factor [Mucor lusitanicus]